MEPVYLKRLSAFFVSKRAYKIKDFWFYNNIKDNTINENEGGKRMCNIDVRSEIKAANLFQWQVAEAVGVSETTFCKMLRRELSDEQKKNVRAAIIKLKRGV